MTNPLARVVRQSGSFIAGLLIGVSIVVAAFAWTDIDSRLWQTFLDLGAPIILALGLALQRMVVAKPRRRDVIGGKQAGVHTQRRPAWQLAIAAPAFGIK